MGRSGLVVAAMGSLAILVSGAANAWFFIIPTGAIKRALETDPDSIVVSASDRALGKCAGLHINQGLKHSRYDGPSERDATAGRSLQQVQQSPEYMFHEKMANAAVDKSSEKEKVKDLADAYSTRWGRVAGADQNANRAYGSDLVRGCAQNDIPFRYADYAAWLARQDEQKRAQEEAQRKQAEAAQARVRAEQAEAAHVRARAEEEAKRASLIKAAAQSNAEQTEQRSTVPGTRIDFSAEAKKSARILGCHTEDVRVAGAEGSNILFSAACPSGQVLDLTCDRSGLCLRK